MSGLLWMILANAGVFLGSRRLLTRFGTGRPAADAALFLLFRLLLISAAVLVAGALHLLRPWALGLAGGAAAAILLARGTHREFLPLWKPANHPAVYLLGALAVRLAFQVWFLSPYLGDIVSYHLPKVAEWVVHGTLDADLGPDPRAWWTAGFELVETWWVVFLHHDVLIEMAGVEFLALGAASTAAIASRLGLPPSAALFAAAIYAAVPGMMVMSVAISNDPAVAAMIVTAAALILERAPLPLVASAAALGVGIKPTFTYTLPGLALLWGWTLRTRPPDERPRKTDPALWLVAAAALLIGGVWYARNTVLHGNPMYPVGTAAFDFGERKLHRNLAPSWEKFHANASDLVEGSILDRRRATDGMLSNIAGWGAGAFAFGLIGLLAAGRTSRDWRVVGGAFLVSLGSVLALAENDQWVLRFILFFPALLSVAAAWLATEIPFLSLPLIFLTALNIVGTVLTDDVPRNAYRAAAGMGWRERSFGPSFVPDVPYARVGCYGDVSSLAYFLYRPDLSREVVYLRPSSAADLVASMERLRLPALYAMTKYDRNGWGALLQEAVRSGRLRPVQGPWYELVPK